MNLWHKIQSGFRALFRKEKLDREMDEEMRAHIELRTQANIAAGMLPQEARYAALRSFGGMEQVKEICRDLRGAGWIETLWRDARFGCRVLIRNWGFTAVAVLTLALAIGGTTAILGVMNAYIWGSVLGLRVCVERQGRGDGLAFTSITGETPHVTYGYLPEGADPWFMELRSKHTTTKATAMTTTSLISGRLLAHARPSTAAFGPALAICALALSVGAGLAVETRAPTETNAVKVYMVNRKVRDFPDKEDVSTPEAAYATLNRLSATGDQAFWSRLSAPGVAQRMEEQSGKREVSAEERAKFLGAEILEVHHWEKTNAVVVAQMPKDIDLRWLCCVDGKWLNDGNDGASNLEKARSRVLHGRTYRDAARLRNSRPPVADPEKHLRPFVEFLQREATDPKEFLLRALEKHRVVILGEVHNRQRYWAFNAALVRSPRFAQHVGVIYLELPSNDQPLMDQFLATPKYDPAPVIDVLRDMHEFGWPDQPTLEFCQAVWEVNQLLPKPQWLRIVLADMARPWKQIQKREDSAKYDVDRDEFMGRQIERDLPQHAQDPRHALFIVGYMHAMKNVSYPGEGPFKSAGWHLCQAFGNTNVFAFFAHSPVTSDHHEVDGRLALGLFETAFAALSNRPMAFPLDHGPFGESLFDAPLDFITADLYRAGFDAFLYLGPLEDEIVSPLIPGFYTDEYAREIDRRLRVMGSHGLDSNPEIGEVSGEAIRRLRAAWWGQPRYEWRRLGPLDAWHQGSAWKKQSRDAKYREVRQDTTVIRREAERLFDALRQADYSKPQSWETFPSPNVGLYWVQNDRPTWTRWVCQHFRTNPIVQVELGEVSFQANGCPAVPYKLLFKDRTTLEGALPFEWRPDSGRWEGLEGLDWHLRKEKDL